MTKTYKVINRNYSPKYEDKSIIAKKMQDSIYPVKYISATDCTYQGYVEDVRIASFDPLVPPFSNTGGKQITDDFSVVCETSPPTKTFTTIVDYLSISFDLFAFQVGLFQTSDKILAFVDLLFPLIPGLKIAFVDKGLFGFTQTVSLSRNGQSAGLIGYGGNNNKCFLSLSGFGCVGVSMSDFHQLMLTLPGCRITRVDLAHDDLLGITSVLNYRDQYLEGKFHIHGVCPKSRFLDDMGNETGKTLYVGRKANGKEACIYEKGKQLGDHTSPWVRVEGRLTNVDRVIPFEVILQTSAFLAALYPPFHYLSAIHTLVAITKKAGEIALDVLLEHCSIAYGRLLNHLRNIGCNDSKIVTLILRSGLPKRLARTEAQARNLVPF